jgi:hypothetical protein
MRRLLVTASRAAGIYAVIAVLIVLGSRLWGETVWVPAVVYVGPAVLFIGLVTMTRCEFLAIRSATLRWVACVAACVLLTAVSAFLVFVLAVNVHLVLGGRF